MNFGKGTVNAILQGQRNLDQMREEVNQFLGMLVGMVSSDEWGRFLGKANSASIPSPIVTVGDSPCYWEFRVSRPVPFELWFVYGHRGEEVYNFKGQWKDLKYVELVRGQLHELLKLFVDTFPGLEGRLQPFLKASKMV